MTEKGQTYLHPDDGHALGCTALTSGGWRCTAECLRNPVTLARAVHRLRFPEHADCDPNPVEVRDARHHLEALGLISSPGNSRGGDAHTT